MPRQQGNVEITEITWEDLLRVLEERPEWRARVRQVVLTPELLSLPEAIRELRDAQYQTTLQIQELVEVQRRNEGRLAGVEERLDRLEEAQRQTTLQIQELREAQQRLTLQIQELVEVQRRHEERLAGVEERLDRLEEAQRQTTLQIQELREAQRQTTLQIQELREAQRQTTLQIQELREAQQRLTLQIQELAEIQRQHEDRLSRLEAAIRDLVETVNKLAESVRALSVDMARMKGFYLEMQYRQKASAYFGRLLRSIQVMTPADIEDRLEPGLTPEEMEDLVLLDLLVSGRLRRDPRHPEVMLALEISFTVGKEDIQRAQKRAALLRKAGFRAIPAVAGAEVPPEVIDLARTERVVVFEDGRVFLWDEVVQEVLGR